MKSQKHGLERLRDYSESNARQSVGQSKNKKSESRIRRIKGLHGENLMNLKIRAI